MTNLDLFDECVDAPSPLRLEAYFDDWRANEDAAGRPLRRESADVYRDMWNRFARFCLEHNPPLWPEDVTQELLEGHLDARDRNRNEDLSDRYAWRLLTLIDNVLAARAIEGMVAEDGPEPARPKTIAAIVLESNEQYLYANAGAKDKLPPHLDGADAKQLVLYLLAVVPDDRKRRAITSWHEVRNRAAVAMQLGAGLTPQEIRAALASGVTTKGGRKEGVPWKLTVPKTSTVDARDTPIARWAGEVLKAWLEVRKEQSLPGDALFPATRKGGPWGKVGQYEASVKVLEAAGMGENARGSFRLRHTFILRQLKAGKKPEEIAKWLGIKNHEVLARYTRILTTNPHAV